jgi:hypothetical protein
MLGTLQENIFLKVLMITFTASRPAGSAEKSVLFSVTRVSVLFAGSRGASPSRYTYDLLVKRFARLGLGFLVGYVDGVNRKFHQAAASSRFRHRCFVACAFASRKNPLHSFYLFAAMAVTPGLHPKMAQRRRTLWMVERCSMAVLLPELPGDYTWGRAHVCYSVQ